MLLTESDSLTRHGGLRSAWGAVPVIRPAAVAEGRSGQRSDLLYDRHDRRPPPRLVVKVLRDGIRHPRLYVLQV